MPLKLPSDESWVKVPWLNGTLGLHPSHEWQYLSAHPFGHIGVGSSYPTSDGNAYLSSNLPAFSKGVAVLPNLDGTGTGDTSMRAFGCTWEPGEEVRVRPVFARRTVDATSGNSVSGGFRGCMVLTRIGGSNGNCANAGTVQAERAEYFDCYALWVNASSTSPTADLTIRMLGVTHSSMTGSSGTVRELAKHVLTGGAGFIDLNSGFDVDLMVVNVTGNPTITVRVHGVRLTPGQPAITADIFDDTVIGGTVTLSGSVTESGGVLTDAHADKITTDGGFGFGTFAARDDTVGATSVEVTEGILGVTVTRASTGVVVYEDDFTRVGIGEAGLEILGFNAFLRATSVHGDEGAWMNSLWAYGATAATDNANADVDPLLGRTVVGTTFYDGVDYVRPHLSQTAPWPSDAPHEREFFSTRPADFGISQHRKLEFKPLDHQIAEAAWTGAVDRYGVMVRANAQLGYVTTAFVAYLEATLVDSGGLTQTALKCRLAVRYNTDIDATATYIDLWEKDLQGTVDLVDAAWHSIDYDCHVFEGSADSSAPLIHTVTVDGAAVVFDTPFPPFSNGMQVLGDGRVLDSGIYGPGSSGSVEGFLIYSSVNETDISSNVLFLPAQVRNWTQETITEPTDALAPEDQASYTWITDEGASAATGDLGTVFEPVFPLDEERMGVDPISLDLDSGHRVVRARATRTRRSWRLRGAPMTVAERDTFEAFWDSHGVETAFNWTPDGETAIVAHFLAPPQFRMLGAGTWSATCEVQEVLS